MTHVYRFPQIDLTSVLAEQNPRIDLKLQAYEISARNFLKAVCHYKNRSIVVITERKSQHAAESKRLSERLHSIEIETNHCKVKEIELLAELDREQEERKTSELFVATLKRQLVSLREKCTAFDVEIDQYRATKATLQREKKKERSTLRSYATSFSPELKVCEQRLRCIVEGIEKDQLLVRFSHLDAVDPDREFSFVVDLSKRSYKVLTSTPALPDLPILIHRLNQSRDVYIFIRQTRFAFMEFLQHFQ